MDTIIEILIDNSNSMGPFEVDKGNKTYLLPDGSTRMELAKKILSEEIIPKLDYAKQVTIRTFHSIKSVDKISQPRIDVIYSGVFDKSDALNKISKIEIPINTGGTPITAAIKLSIEELSKFPSTDRKIILVTDGQETDGGDYKKTAEEALKQLGISCNIFIVGISQEKEAVIKSQELANITGGTYINLNAMQYDTATLQSAIKPICFNAINTSLKNLANLSSPTTLKTQQINQNISSGNLSNYEELIKNNSITINLISSQLQSISEAIENLQKREEIDEFEIAENEELNEKIRLASEGFLFEKLKEKYGDNVNWLNQKIESGSSYDFEVMDIFDSKPEIYIECKASMHSEGIFYLTKHEWQYFLQNNSKYQLVFISNALTNPELIKIGNLKDALMQGKILPYSNKNIRLRADRIVFKINN